MHTLQRSRVSGFAWATITLIASLVVLLFATTVFAGVGGSVVPDYPNPVTAGQTGLAATLTITNTSTAGNAGESITVSNISHTPACGSSSFNPCQPSDVDLGVFTVHNGTGRVGTACAGITFTAGAPDASGAVIFTPGSSVVLGPSSGPIAGAQCIIDFTIDVLKVPTKDANAGLAGVQTNQLGSAQFLGQTSGINGSGSGSSETTVIRASTGIQTVPSAGGPVGTQIHDTANVSGLNPTGTVTFSLYAPGDTTCDSTPVFTSTNPLSGGIATSSDFTTTAAGTYHWRASYSGDATNAPTSSPCEAETVVITKTTPLISTTPSAGGPIGTQVSDTANVTGGSSPTGTVTFNLYGAGDTTCSAAAIFTSTNPLSAGSATSASSTTTAAGTYHWTASYSGDISNNATSSPCEAETVTITKAGPSISTTPSAGGPIGTVLNDTATLSGGSSPTGSVTFNLYAPSDPGCSAAPAYTNTDPSSPYATSPGFTSNAAGVWHWSASYAGDANNSATSSPCAAEAVTVTQAATTITTNLSSTSVHPGDTVTDSATLHNATGNAGGSVKYTVYTNTACNAGAIDAGTKTVASSTVPNSNPITFTTPGTYYWQVVYSGDVSNAAATSSCTSEIVTVNKFTPSVSTVLSATSVSTSTPVNDTATLSGASGDAGGTATYTVFTNTSCNAGAQSAGTKTVTNALIPNSNSLTFSTPGTYYWQVVYSGDAKNAAATSSCVREILTVVAPTPPSQCPSDWKYTGNGYTNFGPIVFLNRNSRDSKCAPFNWQLPFVATSTRPTR